MQDKRIHIDVAKGVVGVDEEYYAVTGFDWPLHVHELRWDPALPTFRGGISQAGDSYRFDDFSTFVPYLDAWQRAKDKADADKEAQRQADIETARVKQEAEERAAAERQAEVDARKAEFERQRPVLEAQAHLASTDFKIVKLMEAKLIAEGALDPDLVAQREAARQTIRDSKS